MKFLKGLGLGFLLLVGIGAVGGGFLWFSWQEAPEEFVENQNFSIDSGDTVLSIGERLEKMNIIKSAIGLRILAVVFGTERSFQRGTYALTPGSSLVSIHEQLTTGKQLLVRVTIPEGLTTKKIASILESSKVTSAEEFLKEIKNLEHLDLPGLQGLKTLEGFLFPDTYFFPENYPAGKVVKTMVDAFVRFLNKEGFIGPDEMMNEKSIEAFYENVILASIVEREYRVTEEAPTIASVFSNRLKYGIGLGSCATIEYIITDIQNRPHPKRIFLRDTQIKSPFNTYLYRGLPPHPISNPGSVALKAAFRPAKTDYLYFVVSNPQLGTHIFSKSLNDHNSAKEDYLNSYVVKK